VGVTVAVADSAVSVGVKVSVTGERVGRGATISVGGDGTAVGAAQAATIGMKNRQVVRTLNLREGAIQGIVMDLGLSLNKTKDFIYH
jgi:hypothetical protein